MRSVQGFIFDLDSLVDANDVWTTTYRGTLTAFGGTWTPDVEAALERRPLAEVVDRIVAAARVPDADHAEVAQYLPVCFSEAVRQSEMQLRDGALQLLTYLRATDVPFGIVSPIGREQADHCIRAVGLGALLAAAPGDSDEPDTVSHSLHFAAARHLDIDRRVSVAVVHNTASARQAQGARLYTLTDPSVTAPTCAHGHLDAYRPRNVAAILKAAALPRSSAALTAGR